MRSFALALIAAASLAVSACATVPTEATPLVKPTAAIILAPTYQAEVRYLGPNPYRRISISERYRDPPFEWT
jgi:hypothetical protein